MFMLNVAPNVSLEHLKMKLVQGGTRAEFQNEMQLSHMASEAITEYHVNIKGVKEQFMGKITEIEANKSKKKIVEEMARMLTLKDSGAPRRPPKIVLMGPPGVDTKEHADFLCNKYKLILIDIDQMIKDYIRREGDRTAELR